jgi:hypothetical protein
MGKRAIAHYQAWLIGYLNLSRGSFNFLWRHLLSILRPFVTTSFFYRFSSSSLTDQRNLDGSLLLCASLLRGLAVPLSMLESY